MFATKISRISDKLTYSEKRITNLLLERSKNFEMMTSEQIAKEVGRPPSSAFPRSWATPISRA